MSEPITATITIELTARGQEMLTRLSKLLRKAMASNRANAKKILRQGRRLGEKYVRRGGLAEEVSTKLERVTPIQPTTDKCDDCGATPEDSDLESCSLCGGIFCDNCRQEWVDEEIDDCGRVCTKCVEKNLRQPGGGP